MAQFSHPWTRLHDLLAQLPKLEISHPLETFGLFPKLPVELRCRIWGYASFAPRKIIVGGRFSSSSILQNYGRWNTVPAILHANSEARNEALRYYTKSQEEITYTRRNCDLVLARKCIYANFEVDTFGWLAKDRPRSDWEDSTVDVEFLRKFQHLEVSILSASISDRSLVAPLLLAEKELKHVTILVNHLRHAEVEDNLMGHFSVRLVKQTWAKIYKRRLLHSLVDNKTLLSNLETDYKVWQLVQDHDLVPGQPSEPPRTATLPSDE